MRQLAAADIMSIWERGEARTPIDRALTMLAAVRPELGWDDIAALPIGQRDLLLLAAHQQAFGNAMDGITACPDCGEVLECALDADQFARQLGSDSPVAAGSTYDLAIDGMEIRFRLPTSVDVMATTQLGGGVAAGRMLLVSRCATVTAGDGAAIDPATLPEHVLAAIEDAMASHDPAAIIDLDLTCPGCGASWVEPFHIADFLWIRIAAAAQRLLVDIDTLARAYGWRESDILAMSAARRQGYLNLVLG